MKFTTKKILSIILATLMLFSVVSVPASAAEEECIHSYNESDWEVVKEPTCGSVGIKHRWCSICEEFIEEEIPRDPTKHVAGLWEEIVPHSCTQTGLEVIYCYYRCTEEVNGVNKLIEIVPPRVVPAHDYTELYTVKSTCQSKGYIFRMCTTCGDMNTVELDIDTTRNGHNLTELQIVQEATCVNDSGVKETYCLNDGCKYKEVVPYTDSNNHKNITRYEENKILPTCDRDGYIPVECNDCGADLREILPRHSASEFDVLSSVPSTCHTKGVEHRKCKGYYDGEGNFVLCGLEYDVELDFNPDNHVYTDWKITKEPGCQPGERTKSCIYDYRVTVTEAIPATGEHKYGAWTTLEEGSCSLTGLRQKVCLICEDTVIEETGLKHDFAYWETIETMSCDETYLQQGEKIAYCNNCTHSQKFIVPVAHSFSNWTVLVEPDCYKDREGKKERKCTVCGKVETETIPVEHNFTAWAVQKKPLCNGERTGVYARMCMDCEKVEREVIPSEHKFSDWEVIKQPTCGALTEEEQPISDKAAVAGVRTRSCEFCGMQEKDETYSVDHVFGEVIVETAMDCKNGVVGKGKRYCYTCGGFENVDIPLHTYGDWYSTDSAISVCGSGEDDKLTHKCTICKATESKSRSEIEGKVVEGKKHPNFVVHEPTCTTAGYGSCPDCGYIDRDSFIAANGHNLDEEWTTRIQATCTTPGARYKACSECDYLDFQHIDKAEHLYICTETAKEPTCTETGLSAKSYCALCLEQFDSVVIPALGHKYAEGSETCSVCYVYAGSPDQSCVCACHSTAGMEAIIFGIVCKIYSFFGINQYCKCGVMHYEEIGLFGKLFGSATTEQPTK